MRQWVPLVATIAGVCVAHRERPSQADPSETQRRSDFTRASSFQVPDDALGPGSGPWEEASPEDHGLSSAKLTAAANRISTALPYRWCFVAVKDGKLVHESVFHNTSETLYRTQSLGKTGVASMIGVLVSRGLIDLDRPLAEYGIPSTLANWSVTGKDYFPQVTARHLLGQSSGYGMVPPGTHFTYDSDDYIQHLSYLMDAVVGDSTPIEYATREFAEPLGVPSLYEYDGQVYGIGGNLSAGGGQMMSCRDVARVGTLIVNKGMWRAANGSGIQLVSQDYMRQMTSPSFPEFNKGYGFLTWLNTEVGPEGPHCCGPRFAGSRVNQSTPTGVRVGYCCKPLNGSGLPPVPCNLSNIMALSEEDADEHKISYEGAMYIGKSIVDDNTASGLTPAPHDLMMAQGERGEYMFMIPSKNLTVVTMGSSQPRSRLCSTSYDDAFTVSLAWNAIADAFLHPASASSSEGSFRAQHPPIPKPSSGTETSTSDHVFEKRPGADRSAVIRDRRAPVVGSCTCDCPFNLGFGRCFNVPTDNVPPGVDPTVPGFDCSDLIPESSVSTKINSPDAFCPMFGLTVNCDPGLDNSTILCTLGNKMYSHHNCDVLHECSPVEGMPSSFAVTTCGCGHLEKRMTPCVWSPQPCVYTPYYSPG